MSGRGWVLFALMGLLWGVPYLMIKVAVEGVSVPVLVFVRTAIGAAVLLPLALRAGRPAWLRERWRPLAAFAALEIIVPWGLLSDAERHLTSSMTGLLIAASPILAVLVGRLTGDAERLGAARWAGLAVGIVGVAVLAAPALSGGSPWAIVEVLLVAACYATAPIIAARRLADVPALPMTAICLGGAALVYAPPAVLTWPDAVPDGPVLAALAGLGVVCTAVAFLVFFALIREVGPSRALVFTYVNPAVAVTAGVVVLGEPLTASILVSFALILAGSVLATAPRSAMRPGAATAAPGASPGSPSRRAG
ncbi:DMT family transporter [Pseudonocardia kunmingensis]|uniref:Drug/metabolite transporter (DMT)-like permease n=1 Tax=Pseudonocardia kunmingensis TaxID=630975 RepID=A0A543DA53_9PSEU|nr:EamA family transporter [Pseudonocardia kunmingensis]TQM06158.1 drug/metabolite transporter (DMT)-like permease [Pseudonocardia kunmingensis]